MIYFCCDLQRRERVRAHPTLNGIDRIEVVDREWIGTPSEPLRQRVLRVHWVKPPAGAFAAALAGLTPLDLTVLGGESIQGVRPVALVFLPDHLRVTLDREGDYSTYTLVLAAALPDLDPRLSRVDFSFKVECPSELDCLPACGCVPSELPQPPLEYLAKDYASFRQSMLDRLAVTTPAWIERNPADLGITLVELFAHVGDLLSYRQDAYATEAYLETARQRVSVRRHARLLDYAMHDGANARTWVQVRVDPVATPAAGALLPRAHRSGPTDPWPQPTRFLTATGDSVVLGEQALRRALEGGGVAVFEPLTDVVLHAAHNEMKFHAWGDDRCCLPKGATRATLKGDLPRLEPGMVLALVERVGPRSGDVADADPAHRHAVRLIRVTPSTDVLTTEQVTEIEWSSGDALPFPLCLSAIDATGRHVPDVSVVLGNLVLSDHGATLVAEEALGTVPAPNPALAPAGSQGCDGCGDETTALPPPRFRPRLSRSQLTQAAPAPSPGDAASASLRVDVAGALPAVVLRDASGRRWMPQRDLLASDGFAREFVVEIGNDGRASIRFGDDENGQRPPQGETFHAQYRVGNGVQGNLGAGALVHAAIPALLDAGNPSIPLGPALVLAVTNPLPATSGKEPESLEEVRQYAPQAFRVPRRCVTPEDYAARAGEHPGVQRAAASLRWTGSWHTVFLSIDRRNGQAIDDTFESELRLFLEPYRLAGHDLEIDGPRFVPLDLKLVVCVRAGYFRADVKLALVEAFSHRSTQEGTRGFFHPDRFTFGQSLHVSAILAAAQGVTGVEHVEVAALQRLGARVDSVPAGGEFKVGRLEIVRLDQDPSFPGRGRLRLDLRGGR